MAVLRILGKLVVGSVMIAQCASGSATAAPANDRFVNRAVLVGASNVISTSNVSASREEGEPQHAGEPGGHSVWWTWSAQTSGTVKVSTAGSSFDTLLAVYFGTSVTQLTVVASNDDFGDDTTSTVLFRAIAGEAYQIAVDGFQGATGDITLSLTPSGVSPYSWLFYDTNEFPVSSADFPHKVVMLDFFATTCGDCIYESPDLIELRKKYAADGFEIIAVSKDDLSVSEIVSNAAKMGINYPLVLNDPHIEAGFGAGGPLPMPTKVLLDRERKVQFRISGGRTLTNYESVVVPLLRGAFNLPLNFTAAADNLVLSWPATEFGYVVEGSTNLSAGAWSSVSTRLVETNDQHTVTVPTIGEGAFYRLRKSQP